jgi:hypothetical protein
MTHCGAELGVAEDGLDLGLVSVPVLHDSGLPGADTSRLVTMNE